MKCQIQNCDNQARYIDATGAMVCGICPIKLKRDSIRFIDVPALLLWARTMEARDPAQSMSITLRAIIGRKP